MAKTKVKGLLAIASLALLLIISMLPSIQAARVYGNIYSPDLELVEKAVVEIDSEPKQSVVAADAYYSFKVPQGNYTISAFYSFKGTLLFTKEEITIGDEGEYVVDLILFETDDLETIEFSDEELKLIDELLRERREPNWLAIILVIVIAVIVIAAIVIFLLFKYKKLGRRKKKGKKKKKAKKKKGKEKFEGDELLDKMIAFLKKEKRTTQKEIRKKFDVSEAKISLVLTDLEDRGLIRKIKKGRGNVIVYGKK